MPRHSDFQKIYDAFMWRYCKDHQECEEGKRVYYAWLNKLGLDDTKPYQRPQEKFSWTKSYLQFLKEDEKAKYFKVEALFPLCSMNDNVYTQDELLQAARSLVGKTVDLNHTDEKLPEVTIYDAQYEDDCVECLLRVAKESKALEMIEKGEILQVSIEADCLRGTEQTPEGNMCHGLVFTGLALLTKDVLPGVPLTRIMPVEKLVESFKGVTMSKEEKEQKIENKDLLPPGSSTKSLSEMTADEIATEIEVIVKTLGDLDRQLYPQAKEIPPSPSKLTPAEQDAIRAKMDVLRAQLDGYRQALTLKILTQATVEKKMEDLQGKYEALKSEVEQLKKPKEEPKQEPKKEPCKCLLTKEGFWARFHELRSEGLDKSDAFRIVSQELIAAVEKKSK